MSLVAGARLPLSFIALGLAALLFALGWLARAPELLLLPHAHPSLVALAHLWLPGFLLSVSLGASYQLMPVVLGAPLRLPLAFVWTHLALHTAGTVLLVAGFALGRFVIVGVGGTLITIGLALFATSVWRTFAASTRRDAIGWSFPLAASWLAATTGAGVLLAVNRHAPFLPLATLDLLHAHAHLGLAGFFLTLLQGVTFQLVPMFTMGQLQRPRFVTAGLALAQAGLLTLVPALAFAFRPATLAGALLLASGIACSGFAFVATLHNRRRRVLEPGLKAFVVGAALLALAIPCGLALVFSRGEFGAMPAIYGALLIAGALSFMILGMLCKIVPFLVWMRTYGPLAGRRPVPLATALGSKRLERGWLLVHLIALGVLVAGLALRSPNTLSAATTLLLVALTLLLANLGRVTLHLVHPQTPAPLPAHPTPAAS